MRVLAPAHVKSGCYLGYFIVDKPIVDVFKYPCMPVGSAWIRAVKRICEVGAALCDPSNLKVMLA